MKPQPIQSNVFNNKVFTSGIDFSYSIKGKTGEMQYNF